jgi:predicted kinase
MSERPTLHLMIGLPCSGKTTRARALEHERAALRLTPDEWQIPLFGQDAEDPDHDRRHDQIEKLLWDVAARALTLGINVILDFGCWAREERDDFRARAKVLNAASELHFMDLPDDALLARLAARNAAQPAGTFVIQEQSLRTWIAFFQRPTADELQRREA